VRIVILAWGSLVWRPGNLHLAGEWAQGGPLLHLELSRISKDGRLTLVIDETNGVRVPTRYAVSSLPDVDAAIADLQQREGSPNKEAIGFVDTNAGATSQTALRRHPAACGSIHAWARTNNVDAVVWTALGSNFHERAGRPFSVDAAVQYLAYLPQDAKAHALEYIQRAPAEVMTPLRQRLQQVAA
jgi:hypothetical protein